MPCCFIVADGSADRRRALTRVLRSAFPDCGTREAYTGEEALRMTLHAKPDVLIADAELPDLDGFQLCKRIQSDPQAVATMILLVTPARADSRHRTRGLECGADHCLTRPLDEDELVAHLHALLRIRAAEVKLWEHERKLEEELQARRRTEAELKKMTETAQALGEAKGQFLAQMSHEIRTPMNAVIGITEVLLDTPLTPEQREMVDTIRSGGETLLTILNDILDFSKIDAGTMTIESRPLNLHGLVEQTVNLFRKTAEKKGLCMELEYRPGIPSTLLGDAVRFRQILSNLLNNAIKFTEQGRIHVHVGGTYRGGSQFELHGRVKDTGAGIPTDRMERLFKPFSQGDASTSRRHGGTGLGLVISQRLAELMDGRVWVHSAPGEGSEFHFTVMMGLLKESQRALNSIEGTDQVLPEQAHPLVAPESLEWPSPPAQMRLLVAEDNEINRRVMDLLLRRLGWNPDFAHDGLLTVDAALAQPYDFILMDVQMPGLDGVQAAARIRSELPSERHPCIIALTAHAMKGDREKYLAAGMNDYLCKPVREHALRATLIRNWPRKRNT